GPLLVADGLGIGIGVMMIGGLVVGFFTSGSGYLFAHFANRKWDIPLRESVELTEEDLKAIAHRDEKELPGLFVSLLPILIPVFFMGVGTAIGMTDLSGTLKSTFKILGNKNIALTIAAACGLLLLVRRLNRDQIAEAVQSALSSGGVIILITAAGGAFGHVLRQTGIAATIQEMAPGAEASLIPLGFLLSMIIRTAQGSATVAMITTVGIVAPIVASADLAYHPLYIALAIGCGSKPISWMNDSGFWVISKMSGLTEAEMLKTNTVMGLIMGLAGLVICMIGAAVLPLT
ncbi:MAG: SLC13 family permease, partial [Verrucomicrobiota bacterium]